MKGEFIMNNEKKRKLKQLQLALIALGTVSLPTPVKATAKDTIMGILDKFEEISDKGDELFYDAVGNAQTLKKENLWVITTNPGIDPNLDLERNYYFVNINLPKKNRNYYIDENGQKVKKQSNEAAKQVMQTNYIPLGNADAPTFISKTITDLTTGEITQNYVLLDKEKKYDDSISEDVSFGVFKNIEDIIPEEYITDKYSTYYLEQICTTLNNSAYTFDDYSLSLTK